MDLMDVYRTFHPTDEKYTFFSSANGYSPGKNICYATKQFSTVQEIKILSFIFSDSNRKLEINKKNCMN
jgi:hypothetical protein